MMLIYLEYLLSLIFAITAGMFFVTSIYLGYKYSNQWMPTKKSIRANAKYIFLGMLSLFLSVFVFLTAKEGFSWKSLFVFAGTFIFLSIFIIIGFIIQSDTAEFLDQRNVKPIFLKDNKILSHSENIYSDKDKEDKENK